MYVHITQRQTKLLKNRILLKKYYLMEFCILNYSRLTTTTTVYKEMLYVSKYEFRCFRQPQNKILIVEWIPYNQNN